MKTPFQSGWIEEEKFSKENEWKNERFMEGLRSVYFALYQSLALRLQKHAVESMSNSTALNVKDVLSLTQLTQSKYQKFISAANLT